MNVMIVVIITINSTEGALERKRPRGPAHEAERPAQRVGRQDPTRGALVVGTLRGPLDYKLSLYPHLALTYI